MIEIWYVTAADEDLWYSLDPHLPKQMFANKVRDRQGLLILADGVAVGLLRYNLFWDSIPFCTLLYVHVAQRGKGYGRRLMAYWEKDMRTQGHGVVLTSTQVDETAQHFYRKLGYKDCGGLVMDIPGYAQPMELFLCKKL